MKRRNESLTATFSYYYLILPQCLCGSLGCTDCCMNTNVLTCLITCLPFQLSLLSSFIIDVCREHKSRLTRQRFFLRAEMPNAPVTTNYTIQYTKTPGLTQFQQMT